MKKPIKTIRQFTEGQRVSCDGQSFKHDPNGEYVATFLMTGKLEFMVRNEYNLYKLYLTRKGEMETKFKEAMNRLHDTWRQELEKLKAINDAKTRTPITRIDVSMLDVRRGTDPDSSLPE